MKERCYQRTCDKYHRYGGRGIKMCDRWKNSFLYFYQDMGKRPSPEHSLDRINNDGNYEPGNCRWATALEQANNRSTNVWKIVEDHVYTVKQLAQHLNINRQTFETRLASGMSLEEAMTKPVVKQIYTHNGETLCLMDWSEKCNIPYRRLYYRLVTRGWSFERSIQN